MNTLDNLRKAAKRWLKALRAQDARARARLTRAYPDAPAEPVLRDVQHALAREHGHDSWMDYRASLDRMRQLEGGRDVEKYDSLARDVLEAYHTGNADALQRLQDRFGRPVTWTALRAEIDHRLAQLPDAERPHGHLDLAYVRLYVARAAGFASWAAFLEALNVEDVPDVRRTGSAAGIPRQSDSLASGMLQPVELRVTLPMELQGGVYATTTEVWQMLVATHAGDLATVKSLVAAAPGLIRCEHNYMPPLHLAVREGHLALARYLLDHGAFDPDHVTYPYNETLLTMATDRGYGDIARMLEECARNPGTIGVKGAGVHGAGHIEFGNDEARIRFEKLVAADAFDAVEKLLRHRPDLALDELASWGEGILSVPANRRRHRMIELLLGAGARVPDIAKWGRAYYFKHYDVASLLIDRGMNANHMTWHRTTLLHDMAWEGDIEKVRLLLDHGADVNAMDDEFRSTPLGFAARWGRRDIVGLLLERGADPNACGAPWATPLEWAHRKGHTGIESVLRLAGAK